MKKLLAILGDAWHCTAPLINFLVKPILAHGYEPMIVIDKEVPWERLSDFDLILLSRYANDDVENTRSLAFGGIVKGTQALWLTAEQEELIEGYAANGGRLFLHHDGIGFYRKEGGISRAAKAFFHRHPPRIPIEIKPTGLLPELTAGVEPFQVVDEEFIVDLDESQTQVFLESYSKTNGRFPQGWCHPYSQGKVLVLIPGHTDATLSHPTMGKLVQNSIAWLTA